MIENAIGTLSLPLGIATNFQINDKDYLIPMVIEEPSVIAAASKAAKIAREKGKIVVWDPAPAVELPNEAYQFAQIMVPNQIETEYLTGIEVIDSDSAEIAANILLRRGVESVVIKMGSDGAYFSTGQNKGYIPAFNVNVKDTVAAGDAFGAGFAVSYSNTNDFEASVKFGVAAGSLSVTSEGAMDSMPTLRSVIELMGNSK